MTVDVLLLTSVTRYDAEPTSAAVPTERAV